MLSELYAIAQSLESKGILGQPSHPWITTLPNGKALMIEIDEGGTVTKATQISSEAKSALRNLRDGKSSFPVFNLDTPLIVAGYVQWDQLQRNDVVSLPRPLQLSPKYDLKRITDILAEFPGTQIEPSIAGDKSELAALRSLIERLKNIKPKEFLCSLANAIVAGCNNGSINDKVLTANILFGKWSRKTRKVKKTWKPMLILEVSDLARFSHRASDAIAIEAAGSAMLLKAPRGNNDIICSLSGKPDTSVVKLPNPTLRVIGQTYLMSMNEDAPCQWRYGRFGSDVFPVGYDTVLSLNGALKLMATEESQRGKTWASLPASTADKKKRKKRDLCIAYIEEAPDADVPLADLLAREQTKDPEHEWASYMQRTEEFFDAMQKIPEYSKPDWHLRILVLHKLDPGRTQVEFVGRYTVESLYNSSSRWVKGAQNVPLIEVPYPGKKKGELKLSTGCVPYQSDAIASFKRKWIRDGSESSSLAGVRTDRIFRLFFDSNGSSLAAELLQRLIPAATPLLIGLGSWLLRRDLKKEKLFDLEARREGQRLIALMGILLQRQGRMKEKYMEEPHFLTGQFLQMADCLHKQYCLLVRKGDVPPQLVGNASMAMAIQSPKRALGVLGARLTIYLAWADRLEVDKAAPEDKPRTDKQKQQIRAKWAYSQLKEIASSLTNFDLNGQVDSSGKAEMLLGYLAKR